MLWSLLETDIITGNEIPVVSIGESLIYALVGFAITFLGVAILIFLVWAVGKIIRGVTGKLEEKKKAVLAAKPVLTTASIRLLKKRSNLALTTSAVP